MNSSIKLKLNDAEATTSFGKLLGRFLVRGQVIALSGELGAGKTTLVKAIASGIGIPKEVIVSSPSYTLINEYEGRMPLYHFDLYRLESASEIYDLGFSEYIEDNGISVIEWADVAPEVLPANHLEIKILILEEDEREIILTGKGAAYSKIINKLKTSFKGEIIDL